MSPAHESSSSGLLAAAEEGQSRSHSPATCHPVPPRQETDQQPHYHGMARRGHPPRCLCLRHLSPGPDPFPPMCRRLLALIVNFFPVNFLGKPCSTPRWKSILQHGWCKFVNYQQLSTTVAPSTSSSGLGKPASEPLLPSQRVFRRQLCDSIYICLFPCDIVCCYVYYILYFSASNDIKFPVFINR